MTVDFYSSEWKLVRDGWTIRTTVSPADNCHPSLDIAIVISHPTVKDRFALGCKVSYEAILTSEVNILWEMKTKMLDELLAQALRERAA